ncbi:hypothetical protein B224_2037 [Aeromonas media WS]|nr:hypothetical protein B224_2037 [Aeromonas media WS]
MKIQSISPATLALPALRFHKPGNHHFLRLPHKHLFFMSLTFASLSWQK